MRKSWRTALVVAVVVAVGVAGTAGAARLITGKDIKNGSIGLVDLSKSAKKKLKGAAGPAGPQGPQGAQGAQGPAGPASIGTTVRSQSFTAPADGTASGEVRCPAGMVATGGSVSEGALFYSESRPSSDGAGWVGAADNFDPSNPHAMTIYVICTPGTAQVLPLGS